MVQVQQTLGLMHLLGLTDLNSFSKVRNARAGESVKHPYWLSEVTRGALLQQGYEWLYCHQVDAVEAALLDRKDVIITTPTASGKSMAFQIPIIEAAVSGSRVGNDIGGGEAYRSLYLAPTKALIGDQTGKFRQWTAALAQVNGGKPTLQVATLTGDTPGDRALLFSPMPHILLTNPDCLNNLLYKQVYPQFGGLKQFLRKLRFVVIDEMQSFNGTLGCNSANLMRRLRLAVKRAGGEPEQIQFILASATIGNPIQLWQVLCGREPDHPYALVEHNTAPFPGRLEMYRNGKNCSKTEICRMASLLLGEGLTTIIFVEARRSGRELTALIRKEQRRLGRSESLVDQFHGTLSADQRRHIAERIKDGKLKLIVATSALEQGVDFPKIDAAIVWGFPGINQLMQRFGRAGRSRRIGLAVFIPNMAKGIDKYFAWQGKELAEAMPAPVYINPDYLARLKQHILAAAGESGIQIRDELMQVFGEAGVKAALELKQQGKLVSQGGWLRADLKAAMEIAMRGAVINQFYLVDALTQEPIEAFSHSLAIRDLYPGAIYGGYDREGHYCKWEVKQFDEERARAVAEPIDPESPFVTRPVVELSVEVDEQEPAIQRTVEFGGEACTGLKIHLQLQWGTVTQEVAGYDRLIARTEVACPNLTCRAYCQKLPHQQVLCGCCGTTLQIADSRTELVCQYSLEDPLQNSYHCPMLTLAFDAAARQQIKQLASDLKRDLIEQYGEIPLQHEELVVHSAEALGAHTLSHLLLAALPTRSQPIALSDLMIVNMGQPCVRLFDDAAMGTGSCEFIYAALEDLLRAAYHIAAECDCEVGCPRCCHTSHCTVQNNIIYKPLGLKLLQAMLPL